MGKKGIGYFHLAVVYLVWGSTFLAIRYAARTGSGFPPFALGACRVFAGSALVFLIVKITGRSVKLPRKVILPLFVSSLLLWVGGHGMVVWASQYTDSSYSAVLMGAVPLWIVLIESIIDHTRPPGILVLFLLAGFGGIVVLSWPRLMTASPADTKSLLALIAAPILWSFGTILQKRRVKEISPWVNSAYQQFFAGLAFLSLHLLFKEPLPSPNKEAWIAWGYLVVFGSVLAYTSFVTVVQLLPMRIVMTYSYVNPIVAIILGILLLKEKLTPWMTVGSIMILTAVFGMFQVLYSGRKLPADTGRKPPV